MATMTLVYGLIGGAITVLGAMFAARLKNSGKISTSEPSQLWERTNQIEQLLTSQLVTERARTRVLESELAALNARVLTLENERLEDRRDKMLLDIEFKTCKDRLAFLEALAQAATPIHPTIVPPLIENPK